MESAQRSWGLARAALAGLAAAVAASASAQTPVPLRLYPLSALPGTPPAAVADVQSLLESAAAALARRGENLHPAAPLVLRPSCGRVPEVACLVRLAGDGVVVYGAVDAADGILAANLRAVDARGRVHGPVRAGVDSFIQSSEPFVRALLALDARVGIAPSPPPVAAAPRPPVAEAPRPPAAEALRPKPPPEAAPRPPPAEPAPQRVAARSSGWRTAGKVLLAGGVALAAAGAGVGYLDRRLSTSLEEKFQAGTLSASDADSYRRVDRYNTAATVLFAAGAVCATTGVGLWIFAPGSATGGAQVGLSGRF